MFSGCINLTKIDLSSFNTQNVTDMSYMFYNCEKLTKIDLSSFNTQNVENTFRMFKGCKSLNFIEIQRKSFNKIKKELPKTKLFIIEI